MRIYFSPGQDPMLLDSMGAMNKLHRDLVAFLASSETSLKMEAVQWGGAEPYNELLAGLEVVKAKGGVSLTLTHGRWLNLTGSKENLSRYISHFHFDQDYDHHHPDHGDHMAKGSMGLIIEVQSDWVQELESRRH